MRNFYSKKGTCSLRGGRIAAGGIIAIRKEHVVPDPKNSWMRNYCYKKGTYSLSPRAGRTAGEGIIAHRREHAVLEKEEWLEEELLLTVKHSLNDVQSPRPLLFTGATVHLQYIYF